jgi:uncharacterized protein YdbL (DUF1318 family)
MNKKYPHIVAVGLATIILLVVCARSFADAKEDALKKRSEDRYPKLRAAKDAGKIGETFGGLIEAVDSKYLDDKELKKLVDDENGDRKELYQLLADQGKTPSDVVAKEAGKRNFANAKKGDYLKGAEGAWKRKE